jgi:hypothetical protein
MPQLSEAPRLYLERARDCEGGSKTAWCADYWQTECQGRGGGGGSSRNQICPMLPGMYKNGEKTGGFAHDLAYKSSKTLFFAQKYLTRYTPETFFEEYINLEIFCC